MTTTYASIPIEHLVPSPTNPRKQFDAESLQELADTIAAHGIIEPIIVRPWPDEYPRPERPIDLCDAPLYEIIAGERRYRAAMGWLTEIPALIRHIDTRTVLEIQVIENLQRKGVNELEEADGYQIMMRDYGYTADELAEKVGKSKAYIYARLKLTALCEAGREAFHDGKLSASVALLVARIPVDKLQELALKEVAGNTYTGPLPARQAARVLQERFMLRLQAAPFPLDARLQLDAPPCTDCPKNTANDRVLFGDVDADVCTDPDCYAAKRAHHIAQQAEAARAAGREVITGDQAAMIAPYGSHSCAFGSGLVPLDVNSYLGGEYRTPREVFGDADVPITLVEDVRTGKLFETVRKEYLDEALRAAGVEMRTSQSTEEITQERKRRAAAAEAETKFRQALFAATSAAYNREFTGAQNPYLFTEDMRLVAREFWASIPDSTQEELAARYIETWEDMGYMEIQERMEAHIDAMTQPQLCTFLLDLALAEHLTATPWQDDISTPKPLLQTALAYGVDPDQIRDPAKAKKRPKPAAKTAPTPTEAPQGGDSKPDGKSKPAAAPVRFRHPTNSDLTWSGRGRKPKWVENWLDTGGTLDQIIATDPAARAKPAKAKPKKAKDSGRASPAGGDDTTPDDPAAYRCPNTPDMLEGAAQ